MGVTIPRPPMRRRERLRIEGKLKRHHELMAALQDKGMARQEASERAYLMLQDEIRDRHHAAVQAAREAEQDGDDEQDV